MSTPTHAVKNVMMSMKPSTKIVKFMASGSGVQALEWGQYGS